MSDLAQRRRVLIMGAAGRDFHNFLWCSLRKQMLNFPPFLTTFFLLTC